MLPSGKETRITYDAAWRKATETVGFGTADAATTTYAYDPCGTLKSITDPRGKIWRYFYDSMRRRTSVLDPLEPAEPGHHETRWTYDVAGNMLTETRPTGGGQTVNTYDVMNRLTSTSYPQPVSFRYGGTHWVDPASGQPAVHGDNLVRLTDARGKHYHFTYDLANRKTSMNYPGGSHEDWTFDVPGNVATYTTRAGQVKTCAYDLRNRDLTCDWSDTTKDVKKTYDAAGRLLTMANGTLSGSGATATLSGIVSALTYTYDDANYLLSETQDLENPVNLPPKTVGYTYDVDGNRASLTYPGGAVVQYTYTNRNQMKDVIADGPPPLATYTYDLAGNRIGKTLENGTSTTYDYDDAGRLLTIDHKKAGVSFQRFDYVLNNVGNRTSRTEATAGFPTVIDTYGYDAIDQVTGVKYNANAAGTTYGRKVDYDYDATGNRESVVEDPDGTGPTAPLTTPYATNDLNQYTLIDSLAAPTYDANGNLTTMQAKVGDPVWTYTYDAQNSLTHGQTVDGSAAFDFAYDSLNRCVVRAMTGTTTAYLFDKWKLVEDYSSANAMLACYIHGNVTDEIVAMFVPSGATDAQYFHHHDGLGSVIGITGLGGDLVERYHYDVYGQTFVTDVLFTGRSSSIVGNRFRFTGREWFESVGIYDYRNRAYVCESGRFLQDDLIRFLGDDINLRRYVGNCPTRWVDAWGLYRVYDVKDPCRDGVQCCDGKPKVQLSNCNDRPEKKNRPASVKECVAAHERSHIEDFLKSDPNICVGVENGKLIGYDTEKETFDSECKAYGRELGCLLKAKKNATNQAELLAIEAALGDVAIGRATYCK